MFDYVRRLFIANGVLQKLIDHGLRGVTSNPTIFERAIAGSSDYDIALKELAAANKSNVMIKVPATPQGIPVITQLAGEGINVIVTLMFNMRHYRSVANAYLGHGTVAVSIDKDLREAQDQLSQLKELGVDLDNITEKLQKDRIAAFSG